jgi:hypothetical protein
MAILVQPFAVFQNRRKKRIGRRKFSAKIKEHKNKGNAMVNEYSVSLWLILI